jgi:hypothetical protein
MGIAQQLRDMTPELAGLTTLRITQLIHDLKFPNLPSGSGTGGE